MKKQCLSFFLTMLFINSNFCFSQREINLIPDKTSIGATPFIFNVRAIDNNKLLVKYLCFPPCLVKSKDETTMKGMVIGANNSGGIIRSIERSDAVMVLIGQEIDITAKTTTITQKCLIALRGINEALTYSVSLEGVENSCKHIYESIVVPYSKLNLSKIPNISSEEVVVLENIFDHLEGYNSARNVDIFASEVSIKKQISNQKTLGDFLSGNGYKFEGFKFPQEENTLKYNTLDEGVEYLFTRDRRIDKDIGVAYKAYFVYNKSDVVKVDSVFYADRSGTEKPEEVFNIDKNKYTGVISRLSCEPLKPDKKSDLTYFRYNYFDIDKTVKRFRFQTENGKLNSFSPERTFKMRDTIIHVTKKKNIYQSSIFMNDSVKLRYPLTLNDTLKVKTIYCGNSPSAPNNSFGIKDQIFMNVKFKDYTLLGEQSVLTKMFAGLVPMNHPEADVKGYSLTKFYVIKNNSVRSINKISVPYFSDKTSAFTLIQGDEKQCIYMINMAYPVFFIFDDKGNIRLKEANLGSFVPQLNPITDKYIFEFNSVNYIMYREPLSGKTKLVSTTF